MTLLRLLGSPCIMPHVTCPTLELPARVHLRSLSSCKASDVRCEAQRWTPGHCVTSGCHARSSHVRRGACAERGGNSLDLWAPRLLRISATLVTVRTLPPCTAKPLPKHWLLDAFTVTAPVTGTVKYMCTLQCGIFPCFL